MDFSCSVCPSHDYTMRTQEIKQQVRCQGVKILNNSNDILDSECREATRYVLSMGPAKINYNYYLIIINARSHYSFQLSLGLILVGGPTMKGA